MTKLIRCCSLFLCIISVGNAQQIKGRILADHLQGFAVNIVNLTQNLGTTNDDLGNFSIPAKVGDSVLFSSVQYKNRIVQITSQDMVAQDLRINLNIVREQLDEVNISNLSLSGDMSNDITGIAVKPIVNAKKLGLPTRTKKELTPAEKKWYTATTSTRGIPIDLLINSINGKLKMIKKLILIEKIEDRVKKGRRLFSDQLFIEGLKIPKQYIDDFLYFCEEDELYRTFLKNGQSFKLFEFLQQKAKEYSKMKLTLVKK